MRRDVKKSELSKIRIKWGDIPRLSDPENPAKTKDISIGYNDILIAREQPSYISKKTGKLITPYIYGKVFIGDFLEWYKISMKHQDNFAEYTTNNRSGNHLCWNEVIVGWGHILEDFDNDIPESIELFEKQFPCVNGRHNSFYEALHQLHIDAFEDMGMLQQAEILRKSHIEWYVHSEVAELSELNRMSKGSPFAITDGSRDGKKSFHITLPFVPVMTQKLPKEQGSEFRIDPITGKGRWYDYCITQDRTVLLYFMRQYYTTINKLARQRWEWVKLMKGQNLLDMSLLNRNHQLKFPGHYKYKHLGKKECCQRIVSDNNIAHFISTISYMMAPEELYIPISEEEIKIYIEEQTSNKMQLEDVNEEDMENIWRIILDEVPGIEEKYSGLEAFHDSNNVVFRLIPIGTPICPVCKHEHDANNPHIVKTEHGHLFTCWQWYRSHKDDIDADSKGPFRIGQWVVNEESISLWNKKLLEDAKQRYKALYHRAGDLEIKYLDESEIDSLSDSGDVYVCSAMGTGKTKGLYEQLQCYNYSYLMISTRVVQAYKYGSVLPNAIVYKELDDKESWNNAQRLIVQLESLHKARLPKYKIVVLDEIETILRLLISPTNEPNEMQTLNKIVQYITSADRIFVMDAFLKKETVEWIMKYREDKQSIIYVNKFQQVHGREDEEGKRQPNPKYLRVYSNYNKWQMTILNDTRKKVITVQSKDEANKLANTLKSRGQKTLLLTAETDSTTKFMDPHDPENGWQTYHNIVYTSTLANSISFEKEWFEVQYVFSVTGSNGPEDLVQMMGRVRIIKDNVVHAYFKPKIPTKLQQIKQGSAVTGEQIGKIGKYQALTISGIRKRMDNSYNAFQNSSYKPLLAQMWHITDESTKEMFIRVYVDEGLGQRFLKHITLDILSETMGWTICTEDEKIKQKIEMKPAIMDQADYKRYCRIVKDDWEEDPDERSISSAGQSWIYHNIWCKNGKQYIQYLFDMKRGFSIRSGRKDTSISIGLNNNIQNIFKLGGQNFAECVKERQIVTLRFSGKSESIHSILLRLAATYKLTPPGKRGENNTWSWLGSFIRHQLLLSVVSDNENGTYIYTIDMRDWIWYHFTDPAEYILNNLYRRKDGSEFLSCKPKDILVKFFDLDPEAEPLNNLMGIYAYSDYIDKNSIYNVIPEQQGWVTDIFNIH